MLRRTTLKSKENRQEHLSELKLIISPLTCLGLMILLLLLPSLARTAELKTNYATLHYNNEQLHQLNRKLVLSKNLAYLLRHRTIMTVNDEVAAKIDIILEQVQVVLAMARPGLEVEIKLFSTAQEAQQELFKKRGKKVAFISFYSRRENTLYLSVKHSKLRVVAHELAHVVVEHYFDHSPPVKIHEVLAQYAESHISN